MAATIPTVEEVQEQYLAAVRKGQEVALDAIKNVVETVQSVTSKIPTVNVPLADKLPTPEAIVANAFDFAGQLLAEQRKFTEEALKATAALRPGTGEQAAEPAKAASAKGEKKAA